MKQEHRREDGAIEVHFQVLVSEEFGFKQEKEKICMRFDHEFLGKWVQDAVELRVDQ